MLFMTIAGLATAQDRVKDMSDALNSINEHNRYAFATYLSSAEQHEIKEYLKNVPNDCDGYYDPSFYYGLDEDDFKDIGKNRGRGKLCDLHSGDQGEFWLNIILQVKSTIKNLPCIGRDRYTKQANIGLQLRVVADTEKTTTRVIHQDGSSGAYDYRAILMLQGESTLFYNTTNIDDVEQGTVKADQALNGECALFKRGTKPNYFGAIHAGPVVKAMKPRVMIVADFYYGRDQDVTPYFSRDL